MQAKTVMLMLALDFLDTERASTQLAAFKKKH